MSFTFSLFLTTQTLPHLFSRHSTGPIFMPYIMVRQTANGQHQNHQEWPDLMQCVLSSLTRGPAARTARSVRPSVPFQPSTGWPSVRRFRKQKPWILLRNQPWQIQHGKSTKISRAKSGSYICEKMEQPRCLDPIKFTQEKVKQYTNIYIFLYGYSFIILQ